MNWNKLTIWLAAATVLGAPLYLIRFPLFGVPTNILELLIIATACSWIRDGYPFRKKIYFSVPLLTGFIFLICGLFSSTWNGDDFRTGLGIIKGWFLLPFFFFLILSSILRERTDRKIILSALFLSGTLTAFWGAWDILSQNFTYDGRIRGFFLSPNQLAMFLIPPFLTGAAFLLPGKKTPEPKYSFPDWFIFSGTGIILGIIFSTYSLAAWIALAGGVSIALINLNIRGLNKKGLAVMAAIILIASSFAFSPAKEKIISFADSDRSSLASRIMIWKAAWKIGRESPFLGIGPGRFQEEYLEQQPYFPPYLEWAVPQPHNLFLAFWLQGGILGLIGFGMILFWLTARSLSIKNQDAPLGFILIAFISAIFIQGLFDTPYWKNDLSLHFWILAGLLAASLPFPEFPACKDGGLPG